MKTYQITILTDRNGIVNEIYKDTQLLHDFTAQMITKYGKFITLKSIEI